MQSEHIRERINQFDNKLYAARFCSGQQTTDADAAF